MTPVVEGRESAYHHGKWTSPDQVTTTVHEPGKAQELSHEMDQPEGAAQLSEQPQANMWDSPRTSRDASSNMYEREHSPPTMSRQSSVFTYLAERLLEKSPSNSRLTSSEASLS